MSRRSVPVRPDHVAAPADQRAHDTALIERLRADDPEAFRGLFDRHHVHMIRFATLLGASRDTADDVVEEVFVRVWERRHEWTLTGTLESYLFGAVRNRVLNARRDAGRVAAWQEKWASDAQLPGMADGGPSIDELVATADGMSRVWAAIKDLPPRCRAVMVLRWRRQMSMIEIAQVMGISVAAAEQQHCRGLKTLRKRLSPL